jgi:hypothetical protein
MNGTGNEQYISAEAVPMEDTRRGLIALREKHGATSAVGCHASNIVELIQMPSPPAALLKRQTDGLQRAMRDVQ